MKLKWADPLEPLFVYVINLGRLADVLVYVYLSGPLPFAVWRIYE